MTTSDAQGNLHANDGKFTEKNFSDAAGVALTAPLVTATYNHPQPSQTGERELADRSGQRVTILRTLGADDVDDEVGPMFRVRFEDGHESDVFGDELSDLDDPALSHGLTKPNGWENGFELHSAADWVDNRMEGGEHLYNPDPVYARADYAEVGEEGIAYGYQISSGLVGEIVVGERAMDEDETDYVERVDAALTDAGLTQGNIDEFFRTEYGADVYPNGDYGDLNVEFYVEYGPEGLAGTSVEQMGDRAENETKLLKARNDWEYGGVMQSHLAKHLGYEAQNVRDSAGNWTGTKWVRDEDPAVTAASHLTNAGLVEAAKNGKAL